MSQLVKIAGAIARQSVELYAATAGNKPVWSDRDHMIEYIGQFVEEQIALTEGDSDAAVASRGQWLSAANRRRSQEAAP